MTPQVARQLDARGLTCPMPIVNTAQAIQELGSGDMLEVLATDGGSVKDFAAWARATGNALIKLSMDGPVDRFVLRKK